MQILFAFLLSVILVLAPLANVANMAWQEVQLNINITRPLDQASVFQSPSDMLPQFERAMHFIEGHRLESGNTCLFFPSTPQCNLHNFYEKLVQDVVLLHELAELPISNLQVTNALQRIHQSLYTQGENGESIHLPDYSFILRWGHSERFLILAKLVDWYSALVLMLTLPALFILATALLHGA